MSPIASHFRHPLVHRLLIVALAVACVAALLIQSGTPAHAKAAGVPLTVRNSTGSSAPIHLYLIGEQLSSGTAGYVTAAGTFTPWPAAASATPRSAPDVSIDGPRNGRSVTLRLPKGISGRLYYSVGKKIDFKLVRNNLGRTSLVQPAPWIGGDTNRRTLFDWTEFTFSNGLWINSTQVDQFVLPAAVRVTDSGGTRTVGTLVAGGRHRLFRTLLADAALARTVIKGPNGAPVRALAPGHAIRAGLLAPGFLDRGIDRAWSAHVSKPLVVRPFSNRPGVTFTGRTIGRRLVFTNTAGTRVASFAKPSTLDVVECAGALRAPNDQVVGPIARTLCAALNRGTLGSGRVEPVSHVSAFYRSSPVNGYARAVHAAMKDRRAYAFAFDDVGAHESLVHAGNPASVTVTLPRLTG